jgi:glycosyltransferase involved in cell wall biosynthesis
MIELRNDKPLISVIMPIRNCENTISSAVRSILLQTYTEWELLLIGDPSDDRTEEAARRFSDSRIKVIYDGQRKTLATRLNEAIQMSMGSFIARMDGDDIAYPRRLEVQLEYLLTNPRVDLVGSWIISFSDGGISAGVKAGPEKHEDIIAKAASGGMFIPHPTFMGRADYFRRFRYSETAKFAEDQDLLLRSMWSSRFALVPQLLLGYRTDVQEVKYRRRLLERIYVAGAASREFISHGKLTLAAKAVFMNTIKYMMECVGGLGVKSILRNYRLSRPLTAAESVEWELVWRQASEV